MVLVWLHAFGWARFSRYALDERTLVFREGWLSRRWSAIELARIQGVIVWRSPADRWNDMATLIVEVAGTAATEHSIEIPFLPADVAEQLAVFLRRRVQRDQHSMQRPEPRSGAGVARMPLDATG
jgi:membrane protein YdbS with pleckstrin-like domain